MDDLSFRLGDHGRYPAGKANANSMRFSLKLGLVIITVICVFLGRYAHLNTKHDQLKHLGANLLFDWQNPNIVQTERTLDWMSAVNDDSFILVRRKYNLSPIERSWQQHLHDLFVSYDPVALQIDSRHINEDVLSQIKQMNELDTLIIGRAALCYEPKLQKDIRNLEKYLPDTAIFAEWQLKPQD